MLTSPVQKINQSTVYKKYRSVIQKVFKMQVTGQEIEYEIFGGGDSVLVLPITEEGNIILNEQYRFGPEKFIRELPGGIIESGLSPIQAASKELLEETGFKGNLLFVGKYSEGVVHESNVHLFLAENCRKIARPCLEPEEIMRNIQVTPQQLLELAETDPEFIHGAHIFRCFSYLKNLTSPFELKIAEFA
ncbi:MAG: hypothetical protein OHK0017_12310 [Patescibacteria group bacterium]